MLILATGTGNMEVLARGTLGFALQGKDQINRKCIVQNAVALVDQGYADVVESACGEAFDCGVSGPLHPCTAAAGPPFPAIRPLR